MKPVWHIVKKDLYHYRLSILLWTLVLAAATAVRHWPLEFNVRRLPELLGLTIIVLGFAVIGGIVQDDKPTDAGAFLRSRPVSNWMLLGAKILTILIVFFALPQLVDFVLGKDAFQVPHFRVRWLRHILLAFGLVFATITIAATTRNLSQFTLACVTAILAGIVLSVYVRRHFGAPHGGLSLDDSREMAFALCLLPASLGALLCQYIASREWIARALLIASVLALPLVRQFWSWNIPGQ